MNETCKHGMYHCRRCPEREEPLADHSLLCDGWHDCRTTSPDIIGDYLIDTGDKIAWAFYNSDGRWCGGNEFYENVKAWMGLPKPSSFI